MHRGALEDLDSLRSGAAESDGVIHTAFNHDFSKFAENCAEDRRAIEAIGAVLEGSDRPLLVTSGVALLAPGRTATEDDVPPSNSPAYPRRSEAATAALVERGVRASIVRLAPSVHGHGDHGFVPRLIQFAREKGVSAYIGDGLNRWPAVHRLDAARVYRLALERGAEGARYTPSPKRACRSRDRRGDRPPPEHSGRLQVPRRGGRALRLVRDVRRDGRPGLEPQPAELMGWEPKQPGLIADIDQPSYFEG